MYCSIASVFSAAGKNESENITEPQADPPFYCNLARTRHTGESLQFTGIPTGVWREEGRNVAGGERTANSLP